MDYNKNIKKKVVCRIFNFNSSLLLIFQGLLKFIHDFLKYLAIINLKGFVAHRLN